MTKAQEFKYDVGIAFTKKNLRERIVILEKGIEKDIWTGKKLQLAKRRLAHYRYHYEKMMKSKRTA